MSDFFDNVWVKSGIGLIVTVGLVVVIVMFLTYLERKVFGRIQNRMGPMRTGPYGILQAVADTIKLVTKEDLRPASADPWVFALAPFVVFVPAFMAFVAIPWTEKWAVSFLDLGLFYIVAITGLSFVGMLMAGWASNNKYAILGGMRAAAQLLSFSVPLILALVAVAMVAGTLHLGQLVAWQGRVPLVVWQPLAFFIFMIAGFSELERQPFDIPTAESEVVGGPTIEYSGVRWAMFYLASYANLFLYSALAATIFFGGWNWPLGHDGGVVLQLLWTAGKIAFFMIIFIWFRASFPRLRVDQLMTFCWKLLTPLAFIQIVLNGFVLVYGWPDWMLLLTSGAALALGGWIIWRVGRTGLEPFEAPATAKLAPPASEKMEVGVAN